MAVTFPIDDETYQGPLHLLLALAERGEVDLSRLSLARLANRYLDAVRRMTPLPLDEVGEFLYMGARLVRLKLEEAASGELPEEALDLRAGLLLLEGLRQAAVWLRGREGGRTFARPEGAPPGEVRPDDLVRALERMARRRRALLPPPERTLRPRGVSLDEVMERVWQETRGGPRPLRMEAWPWGTRGMAFFAALELARRQKVTLSQERPFGELVVAPREVGE